MKFFYEFERKYQRYAIRNLMQYVTVLYGTGLVIWLLNPMIYLQYLSLDVGRILQGQVWRVVTFLMFPPAFGSFQFTAPLIGVLALFMYYSLGQTLEHAWGAFRFNVFFLMGVLAQVAAAFVGYLAFGQSWTLTTGFLNSGIFLAFAMYHPDARFLLFFVLPVKASWMAVAECAVYLYSFVFGNMAARVELVISLLNVILFFAMTRNYRRYAPKELRRRRDFKRGMKMMPKNSVRHRCAVCGKTELDGNDLEFRYCSRCEGNYEYCQEHLYTHRHVVKTGQEQE